MKLPTFFSFSFFDITWSKGVFITVDFLTISVNQRDRSFFKFRRHSENNAIQVLYFIEKEWD